MKITGIICEYNPFHLGHGKQLRLIRSQEGENCGIVCLMSGNFVQRGYPAVFDKSIRAEAALRCGADLVLELPVTASLSSAEGFAMGSVRVLSPFCHQLSFGSETGDAEKLMATAQALLAPGFSEALREHLDKGLSFPAARQAALGSDLLSRPNDILAVEYCKAILTLGSSMEIAPIIRQGNYHDTEADPENPSATALRLRIEEGTPWKDFVPQEAHDSFEKAVPHRLAFGERAVLGRLRTMTDDQFEALPYGSEGLWRKFMHASREFATIEEILTAVKSKRYTRSRLDRMMMCAFLGITREMLESPAPHVRVLALNDRGREILKIARETGCFPNAGETTGTDFELLERRCGDLYGLFAETPEPPGTEQARRIIYRN